MALTSITRGTNLPNTASKDNLHGLLDNAVPSVRDIANADVKSDAAIADTKLVTISSTGKINTSALVTTSMAAGDILYSADGLTCTRLPIGTSGQKLKVTYDTNTKLQLSGDGTDGDNTITDDVGNTITPNTNYGQYTKLCSHFDGSNGATAYTDPIAGAYTFVGTAQLSTAQKKFGTASLLLDGNSDYVTLPDSADWYLDADFTIIARFRLTGHTSEGCILSQQTLDSAPDGPDMMHLEVNQVSGNNYKVYFLIYETAGGVGTYKCNLNLDATIYVDTWHTVAVSCIGGTATVYLDGVSLGSGGCIGLNIAERLVIGARRPGADSYAPYAFFPGYIDEVTILKGVGIYESAFTPPEHAYGQVLNCTAQKKFGTAGLFFDGQGSFVNLAHSADWDFGAGDFTLEAWAWFVNDQVASNASAIMAQYDYTANQKAFSFHVAGGQLGLYYTTDGSTNIEPAATGCTINKDTWYHLAVVRDTNTLRFFLNGVPKGTADMTGVTIFNSDQPLTIGVHNQSSSPAWYFNGYMDEIRISKGIARWTSDFSATLPTAPYAPFLAWT